MILLYPETETAFENNGLGALSDTVSMKVTQELNGVYDSLLRDLKPPASFC